MGSSNALLSQRACPVNDFTACCAGVPYITRFSPWKLQVPRSDAHGIHAPTSIETALAACALPLSSETALSQPAIRPSGSSEGEGGSPGVWVHRVGDGFVR